MSEVTITLMRYAVLCQCLFQGVGPPHPFVESMWSLALSMQNRSSFVSERVLVRQQSAVAAYYAPVIRAVQVASFEFLQQVATNIGDGIMGVELPSFQAMMQDLRRGTFHLSTNWIDIPEQYLDPIIPAAVAIQFSGAAPSGTATTASPFSVRTGVSSLTTEPTAQSSTTRTDNPNNDSEFMGITTRPGASQPGKYYM